MTRILPKKMSDREIIIAVLLEKRKKLTDYSLLQTRIDKIITKLFNMKDKDFKETKNDTAVQLLSERNDEGDLPCGEGKGQ